MQPRNTAYEYGYVSRLLHWATVALVVALFVNVSGIDDLAEGAEKTATLKIHASTGLVLLALMTARLAWRLTSTNPVESYRIAAWQRWLAYSVHRSFYTLLIAQCLAGMLAVAADGSPLPMYDLGQFRLPLGAHPQTHEAALAAHDALSTLLLLLVCIHLVAALSHQIFGVVDRR
ncbi:MAG TPA: cytochrome b/b6 domain-containing protein [Gammaproteobacteria bacterium]|jgi:cytochrome b561|nr:cytochrome b/b6 domain-containing protein [Gammaproteobacteria bacterium]